MTIGERAFYNNQINYLTIPDSVTTIEKEAFRGNNLKYLLLGTGVTSIGEGAFYKSSFSNRPLYIIYNNTGRVFDWENIVNRNTGTPFETGTLSTNSDSVTITTGSPD